MVNIYYEDNKYYVLSPDNILIKYLLKRNNINYFNKQVLKQLINKLEKYHINYCLNGIEKAFINNNYSKYLVKSEEKESRDNDIEYICKYLENNILSKKLKILFKEIEHIVNG